MSDFQALIESNRRLAETVEGKVEEIDEKVAEASREVDSFVAGHIKDIHPNSITPNRIKNSQFSIVSGKLPFWSMAGNLTFEEVPYNYFLHWNRPEKNPLTLVKGLYTEAPLVRDEMHNGTELKFPRCIRLVNTSQDQVAVFSQQVTSLIRRDSSVDYLSTILLHVERGGVGFRKGYYGYATHFTPYICADEYTPIVQSGHGDPLKSLNVNSAKKLIVAERMVDEHTGIFALYLQPNTSIVIQAPMCYLVQKVNKDESIGLRFYDSVATQISTYIDADGTAHYL
ncbi:TPA: hypothetical protein AB5C39_000716 [Vibrio mimicus]